MKKKLTVEKKHLQFVEEIKQRKMFKGGLKEPSKYDDLQHQERTKQSVQIKLK